MVQSKKKCCIPFCVCLIESFVFPEHSLYLCPFVHFIILKQTHPLNLKKKCSKLFAINYIFQNKTFVSPPSVNENLGEGRKDGWNGGICRSRSEKALPLPEINYFGSKT